MLRCRLLYSFKCFWPKLKQEPHNLDNMFSFRPVFFRRVILGVRMGTFQKCVPTKGPAGVNCWKCKKDTSNIIFCEHCSALQKPNKTLSYFDLLNVAESFDIDPVQLSVNFRKLQSVLHPDKFANASEEEKTNSAEFSSLVNKAYQTILLPLNRGMYLLELKGITPKEDTMTDDKEFLMEVMIKNEELEEAESDMDIKAFLKDVRETLDELVHEVSDAFEKDNIPKAHAALIRMKYFTSILEKVKTKIRERGIIE